MNVIIAGLKHQMKGDADSVNSSIEDNVKLEDDFFDDDREN